MFWQWQSSRAQTHLRQPATRRCHDGPARFRKSLQEVQCSRKCYDIRDILNFPALEFAIFCLVVAIREQFDNCCEARPTMRSAHDFVWVKAMLEGPAGPNTSDRRRRVHKHAIHVEQHRTTLNQNHRGSYLPFIKNVIPKDFKITGVQENKKA